MENEYNKRFKNKEMSNDNFDVEGLWDNIAGELDEPAKVYPFPWSKLIGGLFFLLFLTVGGFILLDSDDDILIKDNTTLTQNEQSENKIEVEDLNSNSLENVKDKENVATIKEEQIQSNSSNQTLTINNDNQSSTLRIKNTSSIQSNTKKALNKALTNSLDTNKPEAQIEKDAELTVKKALSDAATTIITNESTVVGQGQAKIKSSPNSPISVSEENKKAILNQKKLVVLVTPLPKTKINDLAGFTPIIPDSFLYVGIREILQKKIEEETNRTKKVAFEAGVIGGINSTFAKFNSTSDATYAEQRNQNEGQVLGTTYGVQLGLLYKGWRVNTGAELHNIWTKLDTKTNTDTVSVFVPQALSLVRVDSTGNVLSREFRDTTVNAKTTRTILHHNNFQVLRIPLEIGRYRTHKKWAYGFSAGTSFNFLMNQSGKFLDSNNDLLEFTKDTDKVLFPVFSMSLRANVMLGYKLRENVMVSLSPQWSWTGSKLSNNSLKANIHQANLILGLRTLF